MCSTLWLFAAAIGLLLLHLYFSYRTAYAYWSSKNVPFLRPTFPAGNILDAVLRRQSFRERMKEIYFHFRQQNHKFCGLYFFTRKIFMVIDPELNKSILVRDFGHFQDRPMYYNGKADPLSAHLFVLESSRWKTMRAKLTPAFTSGKLKMMLKTVMSRCDQLQEYMNEVCVQSGPVEMKEVLARFATDVIGSCAFGIECNSLRNPDSEFRSIGKRMFSRTLRDTAVDFAYRSMPWFAYLINLRVIAPDVSNFFTRAITETVKYRENNNVEKNDFLQLLIHLKNKGRLDDDSKANHDEASMKQDMSLTLDECMAQAFVFFLAGFETSSSAMSFCLFELSLNPSFQDKVREEVNRVTAKYNGQITYESLVDMTYLDQCICETMRKYPAGSLLMRRCTKDWKVPGSNIVLEKGISVLIPVAAIHYDEEYYPDPNNFDPDRFTEKNKQLMPACSYLPFGDGPRNCIGLRFGMMQTKASVAMLVKNYKFSIHSKTKIPLEFDKTSIVPAPVDGIWLNVNIL